MKITNPKQFALFLLVVVLVIAGVVWFTTGLAKLKKSGEITIESGASAGSVWQNLAEHSFTATTMPWRFWSSRLEAAARLKTGTYALERGEKVKDVVERFITGDVSPDELTITYPEGFTLHQIAERTAARGIGTRQAFLAAALPPEYIDDYPYLGEIPADRGLEGYLFPDTYRVFPDDTSSDVIRRLLANFDAKFTEDLRDEAAAQNRTLDQIVTMASIIEREVLTDEDMAQVSGILWKRNDDGVGLDADATVRYALDKWDDPLTFQDLQTDSPYNTRKWRGLPPGPISNPGLRAIVAAVRPQESDYYYYLSAPDGKTIFSKTLAEHNSNKARHLR